MKLTELIPTTVASHPSRAFHTFEFFPPRTPQGLLNLLDRIHRLISAPLCPPVGINVTWGAGGSTMVKSLELAEEIVKLVKEDGREGAVEVVLHLTCTNMRRGLLDQALVKCRQLGIQNILALRGGMYTFSLYVPSPSFLTLIVRVDPPRKEEYRPAPGPNTTSTFSTSNTNETDSSKVLGDLDPADMLNEDQNDEEEEDEFTYAEDLVRYIRNQQGGDWFCIGVAGASSLTLRYSKPSDD